MASTSGLRLRLHDALWLPAEPDESPRLRPRAVYPVLLLVVVSLGVNWPVMSIALRSFEPMWIATFRLIAAAVTLLAVTATTGRLSRPPRGDYPVLFSVAVFRLALVLVLVFLALEIVPPGRSSILTWTAALWAVPIAAVFLREEMNRLRWIGLLLGVAGIVMIFEPTRLDWTDGRVIAGHVMLLAVALSQASVAVHMRAHSWVSTPLRLLPWQLLAATLPMIPVAFVVDGIPHIDWSLGLVVNVMFQGMMVSGFAIWGQMTVLRSYPAISTTLAFMAVPVIGLLSSAIVVDEQLTAAVLIGLLLVLAGVAANRIADLRW